MKIKQSKNLVFSAALLSTLVLTACGGSGGGSVAVDGGNGGSGVEQPFQQTEIDVPVSGLVRTVVKNSGGENAAMDAMYDLPGLVGNVGSMTMTIPANPAPSVSARRTQSAIGGQAIAMGDPVILNYDMFAWSDGSLIDTSSLQTEAVSVKAGSALSGVPQAVTNALLGRSIGDVVQVVIPGSDTDLPPALRGNDEAYVVVMELM